jgi:hypothetical protein
VKCCRTHKGKIYFVIVYNLTRFAREKYDHSALRAHLKSLGISLRSATADVESSGGSIPIRGRGSNVVKLLTVFGGVVVSLNFASWNRISSLLRQIDRLRVAA